MSPVPHDHTPKIILMVEDDPFVHTLTAASLTDAGYEVRWATTGEDALRKALETIPDLILLDLILPPPDGFELIRRFKSTPLTAQIPIIVLSVLQHETDIQRALECGAADYLIKSSLTIKEIARRVAFYLDPPSGP